MTQPPHFDAGTPSTTPENKTSIQTSESASGARTGWEKVSIAADLLSIVSFGVSLYTLYQVKKVRASLVARLRVPQLLKALQGHASALSKLYKDHDGNIEKIEITMIQCSADIKNLTPKVTGSAKEASLKVLGKIDAWRQGPSNRTKVETWQIYTEVIQLVATLKNDQADQKWEAPNDEE